MRGYFVGNTHAWPKGRFVAAGARPRTPGGQERLLTRECGMGKPFKGTINIDIRDSVPDWAPFEPPKAPDGAPSVVYIVLDDVGFSAMSGYGGARGRAENHPEPPGGRGLPPGA